MFKIKEDSQSSVLIIKSKLELLASTEKRAKIFLFPILVGFYVLNYEHCPKISQTIFEYITKQIMDSDQFLHLFIMNILSCKHTYKKEIGMSKIKEIICGVYEQKEKMTIKEETNKITDSTGSISEEEEEEDNIYTSIFNVYSSFDDFIGKNLVNLVDLKKYLTPNGKINWNPIYFNKKNNDKLIDDENNLRWMKAISEINFINDLISISSFLKYFPVEDRLTNFKALINYINKENLPSKLYDPLSIKDLNYNIGNDRLICIDPEYSYSINTKERVPCLMLFKYETSRKIVEDSKTDKDDRSSEMFLSNNNSERNSKGSFTKEGPRRSANLLKPSSDKHLRVYSSNINNNKIRAPTFKLDINYQEYEQVKTQPKEEEEGKMFGNFTFREVKTHLLKEDEEFRKSKNMNNNYNHKDKDSINSEINLDIISSIVKGNDEVRSDYFVDQIITLFNFFFKTNPNLEIYLSNCRILSNGSGGIIQTIVDSVSLAKINKMEFKNFAPFRGFQISDNINSYNYVEENSCNLKKYYFNKFGYYTSKYDDAINNFISSLAGYSLLCYFLEIRDRNNGNILVDPKGHIIHIDFGFILNRSPGNMEFEKAPFKLIFDFVEVLQGEASNLFMKFQDTFFNGFMCIRKNSEILISFVEIYCYILQDLDAFKGRNTVIQKLKDKFFFDISDESVLKDKCNELIKKSIGNWRTNAYDSFQKYCVGVQ